MAKTAPKKGGDDPRSHVIIKGARVHNLRNVDVRIPRNSLTVITGLSGSGKSSLAFDTLYAEGQRRYVESLSSYARQFLGRLDKPDVDSITGISPAVAIEQKVTSRTSRSTVGTTTEIYDYLKLLFARIGKTYSPVSGAEVKRHTVSDVVDEARIHAGERVYVLAPVQVSVPQRATRLGALAIQGFSRILAGETVTTIEEALQAKTFPRGPLYLLVDRLELANDEETLIRLADSASTAFREGDGYCTVREAGGAWQAAFSSRFELDGLRFEEPTVNLFSFNNAVGACKTCEGFGSVIGIDENLVFPDKRLTIYQEAIACWRGETMSAWKDQLVRYARKFDFPVHTSVSNLTREQLDLIWTGNDYFKGLNEFFRFLESESYKIQYRVMLSRYRGKTVCHACRGTRLRADAGYVRVNGKSITDLVLMPVEALAAFFAAVSLSAQDRLVAGRLLLEIQSRLRFLNDVGLGYLTLNRLSNSLSGGESQRINLATSLGSALVGSLYILDEPSIGLHARDTERLIGVLQSLKAQGNTVIVVEHDEEIIRAADYVVDMGPEAGSRGGHVVFEGTVQALLKTGQGLTARYLRGEEALMAPASRKTGKDRLIIRGAREHSLKNIDVEIPLRCLTVISGVSGSGKSTLVRDILYPALQRELAGFTTGKTGDFDGLEGDVKSIRAVEFVDQNPIGKSSRSNPVTYLKAYDDIRALFAAAPLSKQKGLTPGHFSFNVPGGRCETCEGEGFQTISMQFMADVRLQCEHCKGKRFTEELLEVTYRGKNISDILDLTVDDAMEFFGAEADKTINRNILEKLRPLQQVGLGYISLGQRSGSLSGGEAQRVKLASFLVKGNALYHTLFIFDEPTTGLHFHDVRKLLQSFRALLDNGHSIVAIEHNGEVIRSADWVIDMGPEGGAGGGQVVFAGTPVELTKAKKSYTGSYLAQKLR
jgi:excinuclease ABC subunit A